MEKKIDIAELLKDCPKDMELDCTMYDDVSLIHVSIAGVYPIKIETPDGQVSLNKYGCYSNNKHAKCVIFPKGKTTWEGFQRPFKDGDIIYTLMGSIAIISKTVALEGKCYSTYCGLFDNRFDTNVVVVPERLAIEEEKEKLFNALKNNGYRWNAETKTLEKLIVPKFKVGDRIRSVISLSYYTIIDIEDDQYVIKPDDPEKFPYHIHFSLETNYELVHKFDITTLKPFESKVLVRDKNTDEWRGHFFSHYDSNSDRPYVCIGVEGINEYKRCIPYKDNEHLLGKTDDCSIFYKTWSND